MSSARVSGVGSASPTRGAAASGAWSSGVCSRLAGVAGSFWLRGRWTSSGGPCATLPAPGRTASRRLAISPRSSGATRMTAATETLTRTAAGQILMRSILCGDDGATLLTKA